MTATGKKKNISIEKRRERTAYLFIAPAAILIIIFCIIPLIASFYISTQKMGVDLSDAEFVGFDNYKKIVGDRRFWQSVGITLKYTAAEIPLQMIIGVVLSALLAKNTRKNKIFRSIYFLPVIASAVTVGVTWQLVLHSNIGIFTYWLKLLGFSDINLLNNTSSAIFVVVFVAIWKTFGISTIILVAAIQNIPESLYEASAIDGATEIQHFFKVMLPVCKPIIAVLALWSFVGMWNSYFDAMIYLNDANLQPLQLVLRSILVQNTPQPGMIADIQSTAEMAKVAEQLKYATIVVSSLPLLVMYPFFQKYFDKGIMVGSVKG